MLNNQLITAAVTCVALVAIVGDVDDGRGHVRRQPCNCCRRS